MTHYHQTKGLSLHIFFTLLRPGMDQNIHPYSFLSLLKNSKNRYIKNELVNSYLYPIDISIYIMFNFEFRTETSPRDEYEHHLSAGCNHVSYTWVAPNESNLGTVCLASDCRNAGAPYRPTRQVIEMPSILLRGGIRANLLIFTIEINRL